MNRALTLFILISLVLGGSASAGRNPDLKIAIHVVPHEDRSCGGPWPRITDCSEISSTYEGCDGFDVFPVFYDVSEVKRIEYGLTWPPGWGSCTFTACGGDIVTGDIVSPGDGVVHEWNECQFGWSLVPGYARFGPPAFPASVAPTSSSVTGSLGATDCHGEWNTPAGIASAGVCGVPGEDPCACGCGVDASSWSAIKAIFR